LHQADSCACKLCRVCRLFKRDEVHPAHVPPAADALPEMAPAIMHFSRCKSACLQHHSPLYEPVPCPTINRFHWSTVRHMMRPYARPAKLHFEPAQGSSRAACSTSCAWPGTFTLRHIRAILPSRSTRKVVRSTPQYLRPYMDFSFHTP